MHMTNFRIGNDLPIEWEVSRCGAPEDLSQKSIALYLINRYRKISISDYTIEGNTIRFIYPGKEQTHTGEHGLLLVENDGGQDMFTADVCRAFCLVSHSCQSPEYGNIVHLASDIAVPANGLSAYDIAVRYGFQGTEQDFIAWLRQPAEDAAKLIQVADPELEYADFDSNKDKIASIQSILTAIAGGIDEIAESELDELIDRILSTK